MRRYLVATVAALLPAMAYAQTSVPTVAATPAAEDSAFGLGQIVITGHRAEGVSIGGDTIGQEAIYSFNRLGLDDAASLIPGVTSGNSGGSRNERLIFVRGFNRFQVPLTVDGIRVYLPADNRLDYGRFLTPDIAEIQVAKGYVSVLNGPDGMGGAINLVTRKPTKELEGGGSGGSQDQDRDGRAALRTPRWDRVFA
ncbi:TonB-dependent receptor plug domain-containing protein [Polymorphobacter sp. PAMC 29334]|uniref:TonB-dependent receptor plug domain-containing protein n=1 Tax=Polymorphobacter sp. PAMC 29334 TaxID=2862331 RepID=UPI001C7721E0|nr:TonB-dependent receptor plug domain-containing protein [Polymorphobacter sp. PAMC 29334]QYE34709.1 TonB-dependent receptor plug domain-containing protein [Polymorphobacter sp. PAMC 29334]